MRYVRLVLIALLIAALVFLSCFVLFRWEYHSKVQIAKVTQWQTAEAAYQYQDVYTVTVDCYPSIQPVPMRSLFE